MKSLFNPTDADEIINRIEKIPSSATKLWGEMDVAQMLAHCGNALDMALGELNPPRVFIGRLIGGLIKSKYSDDSPFSKGSPTSPELKVVDVRDFKIEKERLIRLIKKFSTAGEPGCTRKPHPFFGELTPIEWSKGMYKHLDHHVKQFGA